jgi:hypothetical protein
MTAVAQMYFDLTRPATAEKPRDYMVLAPYHDKRIFDLMKTANQPSIPKPSITDVVQTTDYCSVV